MQAIGRSFRNWVLSQRVRGAAAVAVSDQHYVITSDDAIAEINFYFGYDPNDDREIVELLVMTSPDERPAFYLHFMLEDLKRAQELFSEMAHAMEEDVGRQAKQVLLCCTSGMTTSYLAAKMSEVARGLALPYEFSAMPFDRALASDGEYAAILLAPQVGHMRSKMAAAHGDAVVFEIPGKTFGSYDAAGAIRLLMHALREVNVPGDDVEDLRAMHSLSNDRRILVITLFVLRRDARLGYRLYDHGKVTSYGVVRKAKLDYRDVEDLIETLAVHGLDLAGVDAIGIAVPGVAYHGKVSLSAVPVDDYDLGQKIAERFGVRVHVDNNCNAATAGCFVLQREYESVMFYRHAFGHVSGGLGTIIDGKLLKGRHNLAGEPLYFGHRFAYERSYDDACWHADGLLQITTNVLLAGVSLIAPQVVFVAVDTIENMDVLHDALASELPEDLVPPLVRVDDYVERVYLGELALCLQKVMDPTYRSLGVR